jgi:hypothetical protein
MAIEHHGDDDDDDDDDLRWSYGVNNEKDNDNGDDFR